MVYNLGDVAGTKCALFVSLKNKRAGGLIDGQCDVVTGACTPHLDKQKKVSQFARSSLV